MDDPALDDDFALRFECPRCGHVERNDYEVIDAATPTACRCGSCRRVFSVLLMECDHCGGETVSVALSAAELPQPADVACSDCGKPYLAHEDSAQSDFFA